MQKPLHPRWETTVVFASFALLWVWFMTRLYLRQPLNAPIGTFWLVVQSVAAVALIWVFVRRLGRVRRAIREVGEQQFGFAQKHKK